MLHKWAMMGIALGCVLPQIIYEICFASPFVITAFSKSVDYEFKSKDYAIDFAVLNMDAKWVKVNGQKIEA